MNNEALITQKEEANKGVGHELSNNIYSRLLAEFLGAFILIFIINFGLTLGEVSVPGFEYIYNVNILTALWIGSWTFIAFLVASHTSVSSNFFNLVIHYRNDVVKKNEFWGSALFQLIGGLFAALLVYVICAQWIGNPNDQYIMGGTYTKVKGLVFNKEIGDMTYLVWDPSVFNANVLASNSNKYGFAAVQGAVNALSIMFLFFFNTHLDKKYKNGSKALIYRYVTLILCISITTIMYANTTNFIRLLTPAIVDAGIHGWEDEFLTTTLTFISIQSLGLIVVYYSATKSK